MKKGLEKELLSLPETLPLLPVRDFVVFPYMVLPLFVSRERSVKALEEALSKNRLIFLVAQKSLSEEEPSFKDLYRVGTVALVMKMLKLPDGKDQKKIPTKQKAIPTKEVTVETQNYLAIFTSNDARLKHFRLKKSRF
jgi:ATP-dependent Lon protease